LSARVGSIQQNQKKIHRVRPYLISGVVILFPPLATHTHTHTRLLFENYDCGWWVPSSRSRSVALQSSFFLPNPQKGKRNQISFRVSIGLITIMEVDRVCVMYAITRTLCTPKNIRERKKRETGRL
jgi:hypothetical protein